MSETSDYVPTQLRRPSAAEVARRNAEARKRAKARAKAKRAKAKTARTGTQAKRKASRSPGGYKAGGSLPTPEIDPDWELGIGKKSKAVLAKLKRAKAAKVRKGTQAKRQASRSPGGFAGGGAIESYSAQVQRKYGGGKI